VYSDTVTVIVDPMPDAGVLSKDTTLCPNEVFTLDILNYLGDSIYWESKVDVGGAWTATVGSSDFLNIAPTDTMFFRSIVKYANGVCPRDTTNDVEVIIYPIPVLNVSFTIEDSICDGEIATGVITDSLGGGDNPTFQWFVNGIAQGTNTSQSVDNNMYTSGTATLTKTFNDVKVLMTSDSLCALPDTISITEVLQVNPIYDPAIDISLNSPWLCEIDTFIFKAVPTQLGANPTYYWYNNNVFVSSKYLSTGKDSLISSDIDDGDVIKLIAIASPEICTTQDTVDAFSLPQVEYLATPGVLSQPRDLCFDEKSRAIIVGQNAETINWTWSLGNGNWNTVGAFANLEEFSGSPSVLTNLTKGSFTQPLTIWIRAELDSTSNDRNPLLGPPCPAVFTDSVSITEQPPLAFDAVPYKECDPIFERSVDVTTNNTFTQFISIEKSFDGKNYAPYSMSEFPELDTATGQSAYYRVYLNNTNLNRCDTNHVIFIDGCPPPPIDIANALTPNGDNQNQTFYIENIHWYPNNKLWIYNRWGSLVYTADGYLNEWDGKRNGEEMPMAVYWYVLDLYGDGEVMYNGTVTIVR
jgi:gliding motility-associated-like protein